MVLFSIADSYERRPDNVFRSIGTLLGSLFENEIIIIIIIFISKMSDNIVVKCVTNNTI